MRNAGKVEERMACLEGFLCKSEGRRWKEAGQELDALAEGARVATLTIVDGLVPWRQA